MHQNMLGKVAVVLAAAALLSGCGGGGPTAGSGPVVVQAGPPSVPADPLPALAQRFSNYPQSSDFFPIAVWYQLPARPGADDNASYANEAAGAAAIGANILEGIGATGATWPETYGHDQGELAIIKAAGLYLVAGDPLIDGGSPNSARSVNSIVALANATGAQSTVIGYLGIDEPNCNGGAPYSADMPALRDLVRTQDTTRPLLLNNTSWVLNAAWVNGVDSSANQTPCLTSMTNALRASDIASVDLYPITNAWINNGGVPHAAATDYMTVPNDILYQQALDVYHLAHFAAPGQPIWMFVEPGSNYGAPGNNVFQGAVTAGSTTLRIVGATPKFSPAWNGLTVTGAGIPAGATITFVDGQNATLSQAATTTSAQEDVVPTGGLIYRGQGSSCILARNLCLVTGQEYRATPAQVAAEAWMSVIAGAVGIEWFCQDGISQAFCLGGNDGTPQGKADAQLVSGNLTYLNGVFKTYAGALNGPVVGQCNMDAEDYVTNAVTTTSTCSGGILTLSTADAAVPGLAIVKTHTGVTYLFVQSSRRSPGGAQFSFALNGHAGQTATVVYDTNVRYDSGHSSVGTTAKLDNTGAFTDKLGENGDDYQVKVYTVQ